MQNVSEIASKFSKESNAYYGHGTGSDDAKLIESIFQNGLRCSHEQLDFTTVPFGLGSPTLFEENKELLNNWSHKGSKQIIVISLPTEYHLFDIVGTPLYGKKHAAFYNFISQEQAEELRVSPGLYLKPEFVMGVYDANQKEFISNDHYYENLSQEEQEKLIAEVKKQYIDILKESGFTFSEYNELLREYNMENPLTADEIKKYDREIFDSQMLEKDLSQMADSTKLTDFKEAANTILKDAQEEIENSLEGWEIEDEW